MHLFAVILFINQALYNGNCENISVAYLSDQRSYQNISRQKEALTAVTALTSVQRITWFPDVAEERRQFMNWDHNFLLRRYEESGRDKKKYLSNLRTAFGKTAKNSQLSFDSQEDTNQNLVTGRYQVWRPVDLESTVLDRMLAAMNHIRSSVDPPADEMIRLSWSYELEASAFRKASQCMFAGRRSYEERREFEKGENLWMGWGVKGDNFDPVEAIQTWLMERRYFDPRLQLCIGGPCEFYVQMIWHRTEKVGCAWTMCSSALLYGVEIANAIYLVCHFGPRSISLPYLAYYAGTPCSFCSPEDGCEKNLCANSEREKVVGIPPVFGSNEVFSSLVIQIFTILLGITFVAITSSIAYMLVQHCRRKELVKRKEANLSSKPSTSA